MPDPRQQLWMDCVHEEMNLKGQTWDGMNKYLFTKLFKLQFMYLQYDNAYYTTYIRVLDRYTIRRAEQKKWKKKENII